MKISFLTPEYPHVRLSSSGGLGTSIKNLALQLTNLGIKVTVFVVFQSHDEIFFDEKLST